MLSGLYNSVKGINVLIHFRKNFSEFKVRVFCS